MGNPGNRRTHENRPPGDRKPKWRGSISGCLLAFPGCLLLSAAEVDESKLPAPGTAQIDFARDIKPILALSCLRCHGPEKPKSQFRLDNREAALKGGNEGVDILPGNSAKSPLIHYVARLVPDLEMPPEGKGEPLTAAEVGLLRAWIDQGVAWESEAPTNYYDFFMAPTYGWTFVDGDKQKFREHYWQRDGANGGLERFEVFGQSGPDTKISVAGHALMDDYKVVLSVDRNELGFIHTGGEQYRKYYDDTGGFVPSAAAPVAPSLGRDLHLDLGRAWIDFGLTLPHWPRMVLGYEYDYKYGTEAITSWGAAGPTTDLRNFAPATKDIDEQVHVIKFDLDAEIKGITIEERFRGEFYDRSTERTNFASRQMLMERVSEGNSYFQGANTIRLEKKFKDWLFGSAGYLYSRLDADATFTSSLIAGPTGPTTYLSTVPEITLERESHVLNLNGLLGPFSGLTISAGVQSEWSRQHGFGNGNLNPIYYTRPPFNLTVSPAVLGSDYDESSVSENVALRYTKIPLTVLFADARLQQQSIGHSAYDLQPTGNYLENPSFSSQLYDLRAGFTTSPWQRVTLSAHYRRYWNDSDYEDLEDSQPVDGYPGFIRSREILTDEAEGKLVLRPCGWLKSTLSYQYLTTDYRTETQPVAIPPNASPGGGLLAGRYEAQVYSISFTATPKRRLSLTAGFSYQPTKLDTASAGTPAVVPYHGDIYSVNANAAYVLNRSTDVFAGYVFSQADYGQNNFAAGVPVGIQYATHGVQAGMTRRWGKNVSARLQYNFAYYDEPSSGGANNYRAHGIFGTLSFRLP